MKAQDYLRKGAELLEQRGKDYDKPEGERSMGKCVRAFNAITGRDLSESEGWLLLQVLKDVRQWQNSGRFHADSAEDCISYAALKAEALQGEQLQKDITAMRLADPLACSGCVSGCFRCRTEEPAAAIDDDSERQQRIQQSGELAEEVYAAVDGWVKWDGEAGCPVVGVTCDIQFGDGEVRTRQEYPESYYWESSRCMHKDLVIAYRICKD